MSAFNFTQPSKGNVSSNEDALHVINDGDGHGVLGENTYQGGSGLWAENTDNRGGSGVVGKSKIKFGVFGASISGEGVHGETQSVGHGAVVGIVNGLPSERDERAKRHAVCCIWFF